MASEYIRSLSLHKLDEICSTNVDQSIRKLVLITNMLRLDNQMRNQQQDDNDDDMLEQQWLNTCLDELEEDEQQEDPMDTEPPAPDCRQQHHCMDERDDYREQPYWSVVAVHQDSETKQLYYTFRNFHNACEHWLA